LIEPLFNRKTYAVTVDSLVDSQVPLKKPKDIDVPVNTLTRTMQYTASKAHSEYTLPLAFT
jgi:hypothetical protein